MSLRTEIVSDPDRFDDLRPEWNALLARSSGDSVTLTWEWLSTWWRVYGERRSLRIVLVREDGRLIGGAPLLARHDAWRHFGLLPFKRYELLASGESPGDQVCSDYIDWVAEAGREEPVVSGVLECLMGSLGEEWEEILLPDVRVDSPALAAVEAESARRGLAFEILLREPAAFVTLPATFDAFLANVSAGLRYRIRRGRREFESAGGTFHLVERPGEIGAAFAVLVSLHQARWTAKGRPGAFASPPRRAFHEALIPLALARGWLRLGVIALDGAPIGVIYNFRYGGREYFYQSGIAVQPSAHLRPGLLLHAYEIESAIGAGCTEYDFLKRGHSEYKDDWATGSRDLVCARVTRRKAKNRVLVLARAVHERLRRLKHALQAGTA